MIRLGGKIRERDLMRAEGAFDLHAVRPLSGRSSLWAIRGRSSGHSGRFGESVLARVFLDRLDLFDDGIERRGHGLVHRLGIVSRHEVGPIAVALQQFRQFTRAGCAPAPWVRRSCSRSNGESEAPRHRARD